MSQAHTLRSYVLGSWHEAAGDFVPLVDPSTEEQIARVSSSGIDFKSVLKYARDHGGPSLRAMTFAERAAMLKELSKALRGHRDELLELSRRNAGTTDPDGAFDIDGAGGTLAYYASVGKKLGHRHALPDDDGVQLAKTEAFWACHARVPRHGVAVAINAFNFPTWGLAEKAACAWLAGVPVIAKPATATAWVTERWVEILIETGVLPDGALQLICGSTGDLLSHLQSQDLLAFTGSADTALKLRGGDNLLRCSTRINVEADSLNAAVLAPGVGPDDDLYGLFIKDVCREITQKSGQKCTAVRRIFVPRDQLDSVQHDLVVRLRKTVTGNPADESVRMGPLASGQQLFDAEHGVDELEGDGAVKIYGSGKRCDGVGSEKGKGFFFGPVLLRLDEPADAELVHKREVFGPVATLMPYDGNAEQAARFVALADGTLVTSVYGDDAAWLAEFTAGASPFTGRVYVGSSGSAGFGSGAALPQSQHGGPGRAGGGSELGGLAGIEPYLQRVALQGDRAMVETLLGAEKDSGSD